MKDGSNELSVQMYSLKELPKEFRTRFELPDDPHGESKFVEPTSFEYLRQLGVFFYRDEDNTRAVIIEPEPGSNIVDKTGFVGYKYLVILDRENLRPVAWDSPTQEYIRKAGDDRAWLVWGEQVSISRFDTESLTCI